MIMFLVAVVILLTALVMGIVGFLYSEKDKNFLSDTCPVCESNIVKLADFNNYYVKYFCKNCNWQVNYKRENGHWRVDKE